MSNKPDTCPDCGSTDVCVGHMVLRCNAFGWSYLNRHPCSLCGGRSVSFASGNGRTEYRCAAHPMSREEVIWFWRGFAQAVFGAAGKADFGPKVDTSFRVTGEFQPVLKQSPPQ